MHPRRCLLHGRIAERFKKDTLALHDRGVELSIQKDMLHDWIVERIQKEMLHYWTIERIQDDRQTSRFFIARMP
jgi:hypothetical protein